MNGFDNSANTTSEEELMSDNERLFLYARAVNTTSEEELMSDNERMFLYARAVRSNHSIQYHMHQIIGRN